MNSLKRFLFGALSALLFATGFSRAADRLDPLSQNLGSAPLSAINGCADNCTGPCMVDSE
jgi:hypothetical protein